MTTFGRLALQLTDDGWQPIPVRPGMKVPAVRDWVKRPAPSVLARWAERYADHGIGLVCGRIVGIDVDVLDPEAADRLVALTTALLRPTPLVRVGRRPKTMLIYRLSEPMPTRRVPLSVGKIEALAAGAMFVAFGRHPDTGRPYEWIGESSPEFTLPKRLQRVTPLQVNDLLDQALKLFPAHQIREPNLTASESAPRRGASGSGIVISPGSGRVIDGRDAYLLQLVRSAWASTPAASPREIASSAWSEFIANADLTRPARDGRRLWRIEDAETKARSIIVAARQGRIKRIAKSRGRLATPAGDEISDHACGLFRAHVLILHRSGRLSRNGWRTSDLMLDRLRVGECVDSVRYLGDRLRISLPTVRRARRELLLADLWKTARQLGNRETTAPYFPAPELIAKLLTEQVLSPGGVSSLIPTYKGVCPPSPALAPVSAALTSPVLAPLPSPIIPPQAPDAAQLEMIAPAVSVAELRETLAAWTDGPPPPIVRVGYTETKRRRGLRERDIAREMGISRTHVSNSRSEKFGLSVEYAARVKHWLMPEEFPRPPDLLPITDKPIKPHHRRSGKRPPPPGPILPGLRLFAVIEGGEANAPSHRRQRDVA